MLKRFMWIGCVAGALLACSSSDDGDDSQDDDKDTQMASSQAGMDGDEEEATDDEASEEDAELAMCLELAEATNPNEECAACTCEHCGDLLDLCANNPDENFVAKCMAVITCGRENDCQAADCYCGGNANEDPESIFCTTPMGPCVSQVHDAAGTTDGFTILTLSEGMDVEEPLSVANQLSRCIVGYPGTAGNCTEECME